MFMTPRPVASSRPTDPPSVTGLPVTTPSSWWPTIMLIGVEHPGHDLRIGAGVGGGDVVHRADDRHDLAGIAAGEAFLFAHRQFSRIADDAAFRAAVGQIDQGVLPGLEHGQRHDFVHVDGGVIANAALERAAGVVVLGAIAGEDLDAAVVHPTGQETVSTRLGVERTGRQSGSRFIVW